MPVDVRDSVGFGEAHDVSRETLGKLEIYVSLLAKWNPSINLVSKTTLSHVWDRHISDSAQIFKLVDSDTQTVWVDVGSGGGLPGVVVAILAEAKNAPGIVRLVESDGRKCAFLRSVKRELSLDLEIVEERVERLPPQKADVISARAFSSLTNLLNIAGRHGKPGTTCLFLRGQNYRAELTGLAEPDHMAMEIIPSLTDSSAAILKFKDITRANEW